MKRLLAIGFRKVGEWKIIDGLLKFELFDLANNENILYAFISGDQVLYVGKTVQPLRKRMYGYQNPGPTQNTNIKDHKLLYEALQNGARIDIYALPDEGKYHIGDFHLNIAAGLEDSIISVLKPKWNQSGI